MTDGTNPVIEPCPFCGEQLENHLGSEFRAQWFHPLDGDCVLRGQGIENVAAWNTRAAPPANPVIVERVREAILAADTTELLGRYGSSEEDAEHFAQAALEAMPDVVGLREALDWTPIGGLSLPRWQYDLRAAAAVLDTDAPLSKGFRVSMIAMLGKFQDAFAALAKVSGVSE